MMAAAFAFTMEPEDHNLDWSLFSVLEIRPEESAGKLFSGGFNSCPQALS